MEDQTNIIYIRVDGRDVVTDIYSSVFYAYTEGDILLEQGNEQYHAHVQLKYSLYDEKGVLNYKYVDGEMQLLTAEEKEILFPKATVMSEPTLEEKYAELEACVLELAEAVGGMQ